MKQFLSFCMIIACLCLLPHAAKAQNTYPIPNGDYEEWTVAPGDSLHIPVQTPFGTTTFHIPIFRDFLVPSLWNYPTLPINHTVSVPNPFGSDDIEVSVNTNIPLIKAEPDTLSENNTALKLQTFKISDIIIESSYNYFESSLSEDLHNMLIPSFLSNGTIHTEQFFDLLNTIIENIDSIENFISSFDGLDLNDYIEGGMALNGFEPGKITGIYKYASTTVGDNGAVLMLGSKYDPVLQARTVVGGGISIDLTDASSYAPFEVYYHSSDEFDSSLDHVVPDSLIILLLSSASDNIQQYSTLCIDQLTLFEADSNDIENTCSRAYAIHASDLDTTSVLLSWYELETPDHWEVEYGLQDFALGTGTFTTASTTELFIDNLQSDTYYDVYVRGVCEDGLYSNWSNWRFKTAIPPTPEVPEDSTGIQTITNEGLTIFPNPAHGNCTLQFDEQQPSSIQLYAIDGKLLQTITPNSRTINLSLPYSGIFMIRCETEKRIIVRRIVNF